MRNILIFALIILLFACKKEETLQHHNRIYIQLNRNIDTCLCEGDTVILDATRDSADSYQWTSFENYIIFPSVPVKKITTEEQGDITIKKGSVTMGRYYYNVQYFKFFCPDSFTPNGDFLNDIWKPLPIMHMFPLSYELEIFDDQNNEVFSTDDVDQGWDGKVNGHQPVTGYYYYHIKYTSPCDDKKSVSGIVQLIIL